MTSRHRTVIFKMAGKFVVRYFPKKYEISYGLDDSFTLFDVTQDSKNMRDLFAIVFSSTEYSKASNFDWKPILSNIVFVR